MNLSLQIWIGCETHQERCDWINWSSGLLALGWSIRRLKSIRVGRCWSYKLLVNEHIQSRCQKHLRERLRNSGEMIIEYYTERVDVGIWKSLWQIRGQNKSGQCLMNLSVSSLSFIVRKQSQLSKYGKLVVTYSAKICKFETGAWLLLDHKCISN